jgi:hypothetical protein
LADQCGIAGIDLVEYLFRSGSLRELATARNATALQSFARANGTLLACDDRPHQEKSHHRYLLLALRFYQLIVTVNVVEATVLPAVALNLITWLLCVALGVV